MKGQKLFVRRIQSGDLASLRQIDSALPDSALEGFIGKLLGDPVAYALTRTAGEQLIIERIFVSERMRGKRSGKCLLREVENAARREGRLALSVRQDCEVAGFFEQMAFVNEKGTLLKRLGIDTARDSNAIQAGEVAEATGERA